jgi:23S rRNA (guanosine2251-2'-O)-methyltransferase
VGIPLKRALVATGDDTLDSLVRRLGEAGVPVEEVPRQRLDALSSHGAHQGIVCQAAPYRYASLADVIARAGEGDALVVVLDHVTDQGNLGAIVRSAEVVGAAGVVIAKARAAGVGVGAYKTSAGAVMHIPVAQVANLSSAIDELKAAGFWAAAASEHAEQDVWSAPLGGRIALVMGSEGEGISRLVLEHCDFGCRLPQRGRVESLNVAQAATVMCYEWLRRTQEAGAAVGAASQPDSFADPLAELGL